MASLPVLPLQANSLQALPNNGPTSRLEGLVRKNQWAFVAYTGSRTQCNTSQWFAVKPARWVLLRHQLESFGPELVQQEALGGAPTAYNGRPSNTFVRGYKAYVHQTILKHDGELPTHLKSIMNRQGLSPLGPEMNGSDYVGVNAFILCVRHALPIGARPYVPLEERSKWALLQRDLDHDPDNERAREGLQALRQEHEDKFHAADREVGHIVVEHPKFVTTEHTWTIPPGDYICSRCKKVGHHMLEACETLNPGLASFSETAKAVMWGPKKFAGMKRTSDNDAAYFALMHKRHKK